MRKKNKKIDFLDFISFEILNRKLKGLRNNNIEIGRISKF